MHSPSQSSSDLNECLLDFASERFPPLVADVSEVWLTGKAGEVSITNFSGQIDIMFHLMNVKQVPLIITSKQTWPCLDLWLQARNVQVLQPG